jgi:hypothetical protein
MKSFGLMRSTLMITIVLSFCSVTLFAQEGNVNFSGNWNLDEKKSELGEARMRFASPVLKIKQTGNNLSVERTVGNPRGNGPATTSEKYTLDGRTNVNRGGRIPVESAVNWTENGTTLTFVSSRSSERQGQTFEMKTTEVWSLTDGGKILTIDMTVTTPQGQMKRTLVYDKK